MGPARFRPLRPEFLSKLFCWHPSRETPVALAAGAICVALSLAMVPAKNVPWLSIIIRDFWQILILGVFFPLAYIRMKGQSFADFGLSWRKWPLFLTVNLVLGAALVLMFLSESPPPKSFRFETEVLWRATCVFCALFFELVFFYAFLVFPFFLGVGGVYDVLIQSQVVSPIVFPMARTLYLIPLILLLVFSFSARRQMPPGR